MTDMITIRVIETQDIGTIKHIADMNRAYLGFSPRKMIEDIAIAQRALVAIYKDDVIGFVMFYHRKRDLQTTLSEICVQQEKRNQGVGVSLIQFLIRDCKQKGRAYIQLKCPVDLSANEFYRHIGFDLYTTESGKKKQLNVWRYIL